MADPVKTLRSLETLSHEYTIFERDQILTEAQLNSVSGYFDDQERLSRVELLGVGLIAGLHVSIVNGKIRVSKGLGLTTDGDLLLITSDSDFDHIKPYDEAAPFYAPFHTGSGDHLSMLPLWELIQEGESDIGKQALNTLPGTLADYVVVMYMESYAQDHDLCSAADCDNLGIKACHIPRLLLISRLHAATLSSTLPTWSQQARLLPTLTAVRPVLNGNLTTTSALSALYRQACNNIHASLIAACDDLHQQVPALTQRLFGGDPSADWMARLNTIRNNFANQGNGIQYYYDFLKDLVETWNALVEALLDQDSVCCPDWNAFPKHLLLGELRNPTQTRTGFYPSPLLGNVRQHQAHASFLAQKLHTLIHTFSLPPSAPAPAIVVTPSRSELSSLEERAIPYYYQANSSFPLLDSWNWQRSKRGTSHGILAYRAQALGASPTAQTPLVGQLGRYDFFRIEGHLGQELDAVMDKLESDIRVHNLPFAVRAVLLHNQITPIKRRPPIRYGDLHRLHKLVRTEIDSELLRTQAFSNIYRQRIRSAADNGQIPRDTAKMSKADTLDTTISHAVSEGRKAFAAKRYSTFRADTQWPTQHASAIQAASNFKQDFGDVSRTDYTTAFDTAIVSNHRNWLDWIDRLIDHKDKQADARLLLNAYLKIHPGLDHAGGVLRGGTFVVVYDDQAKVVADFMLPYRDAEDLEDEPEEPTLDYRLPPSIQEGFVMVKPIDWQFNDLKLGIRDEWQKEIQIQTNYTQFFEKSLGTMGDIFSQFNFSGSRPGFSATPRTGDSYLDAMLDSIRTTRDQITRMREELAKGDMPNALASRIQRQLDTYEKNLGEAVKDTTRHMVEAGANITNGQPAADAVGIIGSALVTLKDESTLQNVQTEFQTMANTAGAGKTIVTGVMQAGGMRFR